MPNGKALHTKDLPLDNLTSSGIMVYVDIRVRARRRAGSPFWVSVLPLLVYYAVDVHSKYIS